MGIFTTSTEFLSSIVWMHIIRMEACSLLINHPIVERWRSEPPDSTVNLWSLSWRSTCFRFGFHPPEIQVTFAELQAILAPHFHTTHAGHKSREVTWSHVFQYYATNIGLMERNLASTSCDIWNPIAKLWAFILPSAVQKDAEFPSTINSASFGLDS